MKLKIKEQYLEYSIGGGKMKTIKLKNLKESEYEFYNKLFPLYFEEVKPLKVKKIEIENDSDTQLD